MSKKEVAQEAEVVEQAMESEVLDPNKVYAHIIKDEDGDFRVVDYNGEIGPKCKLVDEGDRTIALTPNKSNRKWFNKARAEAEIAEKGQADLYFKASKHFGSANTRMPNEKLVEKYLSADELAEYKAIIQRAIEAREADKKQPKTDLEKAQEKLAKAKAAYEKLLAQAADNQ